MTNIIELNQELNKQLSDPETTRALLATTFKGLNLNTARQAMLEARMRGYEFKDFLEKNVYAVPFKNGYSLITSIDYSRKIGQRSGVNGKSKPKFTEDKDGKIKTCEVTVYKKDGHPEGYTEVVYFDEYTTGRNLWLTKPRTMIAKVAEMHALRMACPEELAQAYVEEEFERENVIDIETNKITEEIKKEVSDCINDEQLKVVYNKYKGLGKGFDALIKTQKEFIKEANNEEK